MIPLLFTLSLFVATNDIESKLFLLIKEQNASKSSCVWRFHPFSFFFDVFSFSTIFNQYFHTQIACSRLSTVVCSFLLLLFSSLCKFYSNFSLRKNNNSSNNEGKLSQFSSRLHHQHHYHGYCHHQPHHHHHLIVFE